MIAQPWVPYSRTLLESPIERQGRVKAMQSFRTTVGSVLLCTDLAARGLDVPDVDWVVQYDPPQASLPFDPSLSLSSLSGFLCLT